MLVRQKMLALSVRQSGSASAALPSEERKYCEKWHGNQHDRFPQFTTDQRAGVCVNDGLACAAELVALLFARR